jgi:hypothetical protein
MMSNQSSRSIYQVIIEFHLQTTLFGEIVDNYFHKIKTLHGDINDDDDDIHNGNIHKI